MSKDTTTKGTGGETQTAADEGPGMGFPGIVVGNGLGTAESRQLHQLLRGKGPSRGHQLGVDLQGLRCGNESQHDPIFRAGSKMKREKPEEGDGK